MGIRCNYCTLEGLQKAYPKAKITTKEHPLKDHFPDGVDVYIDGTWAAWFAKLPTKCHCND